MKIVLYSKDLRLRTSPGHGRQGVFFEFFVTDPSGVAAFIVPDG
jgi:hypothetical protein